MAARFSLLSRSNADDESDDFGRRALVTGSVAAGAVLTGALLRALRKKEPQARELRPALDAPVEDREMMEGRYRFYAREGRGVPIVLLHSVNAAASSFEMKPLFDHLCDTTTRPVFALDWIGFGLSDRPPVAYRPSMFHRQLRRFLSERIHQPADVVAYSLSCEFAAITAQSHPFLFRRLILICPTGLERRDDRRNGNKLIRVAEQTGVFEIAYRKLTQTERLRRFYQKQVFKNPDAVPGDLVNYARHTAEARGAHHAPSYFIAGDLFSGRAAFDAYAASLVPTLILVPADFDSPIQSFELLPELVSRNPAHISVERHDGGLMPQFEDPERTRSLVDSFLS